MLFCANISAPVGMTRTESYKESIVGNAGCFGLYQTSFAATGTPTAAVQSTAANPKQGEGRWETPVRCFPAPLPLFRRAFHARSAFSFPLQCPKNHIVSGFLRQR